MHDETRRRRLAKACKGGTERDKGDAGAAALHNQHAPVNRNGLTSRMRPNTSVDTMLWIWPFSSTRSSSRVLPWLTTTSSSFGLEKLPAHAALMAELLSMVRLYRCIVRPKRGQP